MEQKGEEEQEEKESCLAGLVRVENEEADEREDGPWICAFLDQREEVKEERNTFLIKTRKWWRNREGRARDVRKRKYHGEWWKGRMKEWWRNRKD